MIWQLLVCSGSLAGNSIVVDVLVAIFNNLFINKPVRTTLF